MKDLKNLTDEQKQHVLMQWEQMQHDRMEVDVELSGHGEKLRDFIIEKGVWNPTIVTARYHASYLWYNNARLYKDKDALDMGTGTGLMGVVMSLGGAKSVVLSDISRLAVANTKENIERFGVGDKATTVQGDLFENVSGTFDFIDFNHPYFADEPPKEDTIAASMLAPGDMVEQFLKDVPQYLKPGGIIMMPFYTKAGDINNPAIQGPKHNFEVTTTLDTESRSGLQKGEIMIYELKLKS